MSNTESKNPGFLIHFDGTRLPVEREADVIEINVVDRVDAPSSFSIIVSDQQQIWLDSDDYFVGAEVKIALGYNEELEVLIEGEITGMDARFINRRGTIVTLKGKNRLHRLDKVKSTKAYTGMTESEIVEEIAGQAGLSADVITDSTNRAIVLQKDQTGLEYIMAFSRRFDCFTRVEGKTNLICKPIPRNKSENVILEKGKTLLSFTAEKDTSELISEVGVRNWDYKMTQNITGQSTAQDIDSSGGMLIDSKFGGAKEEIFDPYVADINRADTLARNVLARNGRKYIKAQGSCRGDNRILAGSILKLNALGADFSGKYLAVSVKHSFLTHKGYMTEFNLVNFFTAEGAGDENSEGQPVEQKQKNPAITNLQWKDMDNQVINEALVGQMVKLTADVTDISDGQQVKIIIFEKDEGKDSNGNNNEDDEIGSYTGKVKNKKIEFSWEVEYHEDNDDEESENEQKEKGYTLPEYVFVLKYETGNITTEKSPLLAVKDWIEFEVFDDLSGDPMKNYEYKLYDVNDNEIDSGTLNDKGKTRVEGIGVSKCYILIKETEEESRDDDREERNDK